MRSFNSRKSRKGSTIKRVHTLENNFVIPLLKNNNYAICKGKHLTEESVRVDSSLFLKIVMWPQLREGTKGSGALTLGAASIFHWNYPNKFLISIPRRI